MRDASAFEGSGEPAQYWEARARRYAAHGEGLSAVCSFGMPAFYNSAIQLTQRLALGPWLEGVRGKTVLDAGCGVGRWSRWLAARGALVTGLDLSPTMAAEARRRADAAGLGGRCRFIVGDLASFATGERYDLAVGVTVLQHILDEARFERALANLVAHLAPAGKLVVLEAAPARRVGRCDSPIFRARDERAYLDAFERAGLRVARVTGVDPAPFKTLFLPYYRRLPRPLANALLFAATAAGLPIDALAGRRLARASWHKVFALERRHA